MHTLHEQAPVDEEQPAALRVADELRSSILVGDLRPDARVRDVSVAAEHGVSRNTARAALHQLEMEGLVTSRRHSGYSVRRLTTDDVLEIFKVRRIIELSAVRSSGRSPQALLAEVNNRVIEAEQLVRSGRWHQVETASLYFHQALVDLAESKTLSGFFRTQLAQLRLAFALMPGESERQVDWIPRDRAICDLLRSGEREAAAKALEEYLDQSEIELLDSLRRWG